MSALGLAGVVVERNVLTYRRQWVAFLTGFLEPVFYLFSLGVGLARSSAGSRCPTVGW